jgi:hypothetical protein
MNLSNVARVAVFAALAFAVNAPFWAIPNIETFSLALFLSGLFLGWFNGAAAAAVAGIIFIFFNPGGPQPVIIVGLTQVLGFIFFALSGGALRNTILKSGSVGRAVLILAVCGFILTLWYDLSTNLVFALTFGPFWPTMIAGITFGATHLLSNTILFAITGTVVLKIWKRIEFISPPLSG